MTAVEFLKLFPEVKRDYPTGGGCTAWEVSLPGDAYVLITDGDDACQPTTRQRRATFGVCFSCCDHDIPAQSLTWADGARWLRGVLDGAAILKAASGPDAYAGFKATLAIENAVGFYDALRPRMDERTARESAVFYLLSKIPTADETTGAVWLADALAWRAQRKTLEG